MQLTEVLRVARAIPESSGVVRALHIEHFARRTDHDETISQEIRKFGVSETITDDDQQFLVGVTLAAAPHTPVTKERVAVSNAVSDSASVEREQVENYFVGLNPENANIPLHFVHWWIPEHPVSSPTGVFRFKELSNVAPETRQHIYRELGDQVTTTLYVSYETMGVFDEELSQKNGVLWYGVFGHVPKEHREPTGLHRGPQSHALPHFHICALPPEALKAAARPDTLEQKQLLKMASKQNLHLYRIFSHGIENMIQKVPHSGWNIQEKIDANLATDADPRTFAYAGISWQSEDPKGATPEEAMTLLTDTISHLQDLFDVCRNFVVDRNYEQFSQQLVAQGYDEDQARYWASFLKKLKPVGSDASFTFPGDFSGGYSFDYILSDGELRVTAVHLTPRFSDKNIYEDLVGYVLLRNGKV